MYKEKYNIGDLDRKVIFENWDYTKDIGSGNVKTLRNSFARLAKFENRTGQEIVTGAQQVYPYNAKVVVRYNPNIVSTTTFVHSNSRYKIESISIDDERKKRFMIIRSSFMYGPLVDGGYPTPFGPVLLYEYDGTGGETEWQTNDLLNKTIVGAFKDGISYEILFAPATPHPLKKQVLYTPATGTFNWSIEYAPDEHTTIQYL